LTACFRTVVFIQDYGVTGQKSLLKKEGHSFGKKGKRVVVADWQENLYKPW